MAGRWHQTAVQVSRNASQITATFRAPRDGNFSFGVSIAGTELALLTPGMESYNCASVKEPLMVRYPYDWTARNQGSNSLGSRARLIMPGLKVDGQLYVVDTHELFSLRVEPCTDGNVRAIFGSKRHSVTTRSSAITLRHLVGLLQGLHLADMNV
jgi:hypothetical protein